MNNLLAEGHGAKVNHENCSDCISVIRKLIADHQRAMLERITKTVKDRVTSRHERFLNPSEQNYFNADLVATFAEVITYELAKLGKEQW